MAVNFDSQLLDAIFDRDSRGDTPEERAKTSKRIFVRSQDHLAFDSAEATGLRISAWQALQAFGLKVLEEIVEYGSAILTVKPNEPAETLRKQRELLGLSIHDLANSLHIKDAVVADAENPLIRSEIHFLCKMAQKLALEEITLGFEVGARGDKNLALRLKELRGHETEFNANTVLAFDEAAWVIRTQSLLAKWRGDHVATTGKFTPSPNYGSPGYPAWQQGYYLAQEARRILELGDDPIECMRSFLGDKLGIPVVQLALPSAICGATIAVDGFRGIALNITGHNENVWVRRATLAHELGHLLWDPEEKLNRLQVDRYSDLELLNQKRNHKDNDYSPIEARANAFGIEFLAPQKMIGKIFEGEGTPAKGLRKVMDIYGISYQAAKSHILNTCDREIDIGKLNLEDTDPTDDWKGKESYTLDYFKPKSVPYSRRGLFANEVACAEDNNMITSDIAALYLGCEINDYLSNKDAIKEVFI